MKITTTTAPSMRYDQMLIPGQSDRPYGPLLRRRNASPSLQEKHRRDQVDHDGDRRVQGSDAREEYSGQGPVSSPVEYDGRTRLYGQTLPERHGRNLGVLAHTPPPISKALFPGGPPTHYLPDRLAAEGRTRGRDEESMSTRELVTYLRISSVGGGPVQTRA